MLEQVLAHLKNWFLLPGGVHPGKYTILEGRITLPFLQSGQYFRILGSVFNDGLYQYGENMPSLQDETFSGTVWALAVPKAVLDLADEISAWQEKYGNTAESPYTSESFGGYSYTKSGDAGDGMTSGSWQGVFRSRLDLWRKLREI